MRELVMFLMRLTLFSATEHKGIVRRRGDCRRKDLTFTASKDLLDVGIGLWKWFLIPTSAIAILIRLHLHDQLVVLHLHLLGAVMPTTPTNTNLTLTHQSLAHANHTVSHEVGNSLRSCLQPIPRVYEAVVMAVFLTLMFIPHTRHAVWRSWRACVTSPP
jgi:hypothetical protein